MRKLNESQRDAMDTLMPVALFWIVMYFFLSTAPNHIKEDKIIKYIPVHVQSPVLEKYGELITNNK